MGGSKSHAEKVVYGICTALVCVGTGLCIAGLFVPYWYERDYTEGIVVNKVYLGLWMDLTCEGKKECEIQWLTSDEYERHERVSMPYFDLIQGFETAAVVVALLAVVGMVFLWICKNGRPRMKTLSHILFFTPAMLAGFFSVIGTLILASKGESGDASWAAFFSGIGGALLFIAGCMSCVIFRYDPSYGTLENPVSPKYISAY